MGRVPIRRGGSSAPSPCYSTRTPKRSCRPSSSPSAPRMRTRISTTTSSRPSSRCTRRRVRVCTSFARCSDRCGGRHVAPWEAARDDRDAAAAARRAEVSVSESEKESDAERDEDAGPRLPEPRHLFAMLQSGNAAPSFARGGAAGTSGAGLGARRPREGPVLHAGLAVPLSAASLALARGDWPVPEDAGVGAGKLDFDIPRLTKFMLLSAHLATMNKESGDRRLFGHMVEGRKAGTAAAGPSSKRRRGAMGADRQQEAAATAAMEGPGTFNLERLLAYFRIVTKHAYDEDDAARAKNSRGSSSPRTSSCRSAVWWRWIADADERVGRVGRRSVSMRHRERHGEENRRQLARQPRQLPLLHVARERSGRERERAESARTSVRGETSSARVARGSRRF